MRFSNKDIIGDFDKNYCNGGWDCGKYQINNNIIWEMIFIERRVKDKA